MLIAPLRKIVDLRIGEPHDNAGLSLKAAFLRCNVADLRIDRLMLLLSSIPYRLP